MLKRLNKILYISIISMFLLASSVFAVTYEPIEAPYTEEYKEYIELSDEEKSKVLEPRKYDVSNEDNSTNNALLKNEKITLKNLVSMLKSSSTSVATRFSLKDIIENNLSIRNQQNVNCCWTFASISSLETNLALKNYNNKATEKIYDFSERHMAYTMSQSFLTGQTNKYGYSHKVGDGGTYLMATAYLTNGQGAINETDMQFVDTEEDIDISEIQNKTVQTTVNNIIWFDEITDLKNADETKLAKLQQELKEHVSTYGSVYAAVYSPDGSEKSKQYINEDTGAMYVDEKNEWTEDGEKHTLEPNHAVSIIGWDDEYSKSNFTTQPTNDGAWIVRNSWGEKEEYTFDEIKAIVGTEISDEQFENMLEILEEDGYTIDRTNQKISKKRGDDGIYYVSYEDVNIYTNLVGIVSASDTKTYDNLYQVDELGANKFISWEQTKTNDTYIANVFTRNTTDTEYLTSIGITNYAEGTYEVYINPNGTSKAKEDLQKAELTEGNEITLTAGYNTINFKKAYKLTGTNFVVALKVKHTDGEYTYISFESKSDETGYGDDNVSSNAGESFIVFEQDFGTDSNWVDVGDSSNLTTFIGNLCIKGITQNNYTGEVANVELGTTEENPGENNSEEGKQEENPEGNTPQEGTTSENSNYSNAKANLTSLKLNSDNTNNEFEIKLEIKNIQVENLCDKYEHYFYICSEANKENIPDSKWQKADSFEKQSDGTYTLSITINDEAQLSDLDENSKNAYIYIKEIATMGTTSTTTISKGMEITIDTSNLEIKNEEEEGTKVVTYTTQQTEQSKTSTDTTTSTSKLPNTGIKTVFIAIGIILVILLISYIKYKSMNDI